MSASNTFSILFNHIPSRTPLNPTITPTPRSDQAPTKKHFSVDSFHITTLIKSLCYPPVWSWTLEYIEVNLWTSVVPKPQQHFKLGCTSSKGRELCIIAAVYISRQEKPYHLSYPRLSLSKMRNLVHIFFPPFSVSLVISPSPGQVPFIKHRIPSNSFNVTFLILAILLHSFLLVQHWVHKPRWVLFMPKWLWSKYWNERNTEWNHFCSSHLCWCMHVFDKTPKRFIVPLFWNERWYHMAQYLLKRKLMRNPLLNGSTRTRLLANT